MNSSSSPRWLRLGRWLVLAAACGGVAAPALAAAERGPVRKPATAAMAAAPVESEARVIVKFKADAGLMRALSAGARAAAPPQHAQALGARLGLTLTDGRPIGARAQVVKAHGMTSRDLAATLAAQPDVEYAEVDGRMHALALPDDPRFVASSASTPATGQWYLRAPTSATIADPTSIVSAINAQAAWDVTRGGPDIVVAVLDTGVRFDHPDFFNIDSSSKLLPGYDFVSDARTANDGDGRDADASDPGDFVTSADVGVVPGCTSGDVGHSSWHGTQTAGLIGAATNNGVGMAGAGWDVKLLPVRVLGRCGGYDSDIQAAMLWAAGLSSVPTPNPNPARVINLSLGAASACSQGYRDVIRDVVAKNVAVVVAAGNEGLAVGSPANCPGAIAVAGVRHAGTKVGYSDLGPEIAIAAPAGNCVNLTGTCLFPLLTTSNSGTTTPVAGAAGATYTSGGADASLGTSFAAPLVSGTVGLMFASNRELTVAQVRTALQSTARPFPATGAGAGVAACTAPTPVAQDSECYCTTSTCGAGLLDAGAAVASVASVTSLIEVASTTVDVGATVALDGSKSRPSFVASHLLYQWSVTDGAAVAAITSATNARTATLAANAVGNVTVSLTVTDDAGLQGVSSVTLHVVDPNAPVPTTPAPSSGGGGAMELGWLLGWLASVVGVRVVTPRRRRG